jgi:hypothetical protein
LSSLEFAGVYNALNFSGVAWLSDPVFGPPNQTALMTKISAFLCPSDSDYSFDPYHLGHANYRGNAGTLPHNLADDSPDGSGRNDGIFWYQSAVRPSAFTDGASSTSMFSERCLGSAYWPNLRSDYYLNDLSSGYWPNLRSDFYLNGANLSTCLTVVPGVSSRYAVAHELSGERWGDGALFYTRYNHVFTPNKPSCLLGGTNDYQSPVVVTATSRHAGGVNLATADGAVHFITDQVDPAIWKALGTISGGEMVSDNTLH